MPEWSPDDRADQLIASPAGCVLLLIAEKHNLTPEDLAKPEIGLFAIGTALGEIIPWRGDHDLTVAGALRHGPRLRQRALELVNHPDIAWWWAPIDRDNQLWLRFPEDEGPWPTPETMVRPTDPRSRFDAYVHAPRPQLVTANASGDLSSELAVFLSHASDRGMEYPIHRRRVTIRPDARVLDIDSAQDWHDLVRRYPANGTHSTHPDDTNTPWGQADGLMVPDWSLVAQDWDGIHITLWGLLTAIQVRVTSDIGWTEPWAWEGAHAILLDWVFDTVEELPAIEDNRNVQEGPRYWVEALDFSDPQGFVFTMQPPGGWPVERGVTSEPFGEVDGQPVERYTLTNDTGMSVSILTYGGIVQSMTVPDRQGRLDNIVLGFNNLDDYIERSPYFGAIVGRYANRIAGGRFDLDGTTYQVPVNNGPNSLHGGVRGFDRRVWTARLDPHPESLSLILTRTSPDGEEGYPGSVDVTVGYLLLGNALHISYHATTSAPTVLNLSNHTYFNLAGEGNGTILRHALLLRASHYTPVDASLIPTGEIAPVAGTPFDFTEARVIGDRIDQADEQLAFAGGYDHNFVFDRAEDMPFQPNFLARVVDPVSGRVMDVSTDQPGVQFYSGNFLDGSFAGTSGRVYERRAGFCLETQHFPDSPNQPHFPSTVLQPGERGFNSFTTYAFGML
jgi:aldose 1-epimerase